ncbi:MAG: hypothetical protein V3V40_03995 [Nitrosomonadaceae bacterium]
MARAQSELGFKKVLSVGVDAEAAIVQVGGVAEDSLGYIHVTDQVDCSVKKFDKYGKYLGKAGRYGRGEGEFQGPRKISIHDGLLAISDSPTAVVHIFGTDHTYRHSLTMPSAVGDVAFDKRGRLYVACYTDYLENLLILYDLEGQIVNRVACKAARGDMFFDAVSISVTPENNLVVVYRHFNVIELYSPEGEFAKSFSVTSLPLQSKAKKLPNGRSVPADVLLADVGVDGIGRIYILGGAYSPTPYRDVYIFDQKGNLLNTLTLPEVSGVLVLSNRGNLFTREKQRTIVSKYEIIGKIE